MAQVLGPRHRGRRKEQLRITASELAPTVKAAKGMAQVTVELVPAEGKQKAETITFEIPKGAVVVPFGLTKEKAEANAREQIRLGAVDAAKAAGNDNGKSGVSIGSVGIMLDDGTETAVFYLKASEEKA
jgi:hypothetical protein